MSNKKPFLRLVHSKSSSELLEQNRLELDRIQMDLFPQAGKDDALFFIHPNDSNIDDIIGFIDDIMVHHIIDIREAPFLSFDGITREFFLGTLESQKITYSSLYGAMYANDMRSMIGLFQEMTGNSASQGMQQLLNKIKDMVKSGPSIVFTDKPPSSDPIARNFSVTLSQLKISHSPQYMDCVPPLLKQM